MAPLLESIPNLSEGRDPAAIAALVAAADRPGVRRLDVSSDPDHHRTVLTLAGEPAPLVEALVALYAEAVERIDLGRHRGVHPRIGAVDVVPFVPLGGTPMEVAVDAARRLGATVGERFGIPVWLYEEAAGGRRLPELRRGELAGLEARLADPAWRPDFGPPRLHPTAGATVIGARRPLVAYNAVLDTADVGVARRVAARVREAGGGLPAVRAIGVYLESRRRAQVSLNLVDPERTSIVRALTAVAGEAARLGAAVTDCELVGLVPEEAVLAAFRDAARLPGFDPSQLLERRLAAAPEGGCGTGDDEDEG